jgi:hypothetical protein
LVEIVKGSGRSGGVRHSRRRRRSRAVPALATLLAFPGFSALSAISAMSVIPAFAGDSQLTRVREPEDTLKFFFSQRHHRKTRLFEQRHSLERGLGLNPVKSYWWFHRSLRLQLDC